MPQIHWDELDRGNEASFATTLVPQARILDQTMPRAQTGRNGFRHPSRKLRFDDLGSTLRANKPELENGEASVASEPGRGHSGRRFVVVAVVVVLLAWGGLYLAFQRWRESYRHRAAYGAAHVVSAIDPLKQVTPPDLDPAAWRDALDKTHAMLMTVVGSNLLDLDDMNKLRGELDQFVARAEAHPESARTELASIWNEMADRAEFLFQDSRDPTHDRHVRPEILPPRPAKVKGRGPSQAR